MESGSDQDGNSGSGDPDSGQSFQQDGEDKPVGNGTCFVAYGNGHRCGAPEVLELFVSQGLFQALADFRTWVHCWRDRVGSKDLGNPTLRKVKGNIPPAIWKFHDPPWKGSANLYKENRFGFWGN
jgi:hypothetical protein